MMSSQPQVPPADAHPNVASIDAEAPTTTAVAATPPMPSQPRVPPLASLAMPSSRSDPQAATPPKTSQLSHEVASPAGGVDGHHDEQKREAPPSPAGRIGLGDAADGSSTQQPLGTSPGQFSCGTSVVSVSPLNEFGMHQFPMLHDSRPTPRRDLLTQPVGFRSGPPGGGHVDGDGNLHPHFSEDVGEGDIHAHSMHLHRLHVLVHYPKLRPAQFQPVSAMVSRHGREEAAEMMKVDPALRRHERRLKHKKERRYINPAHTLPGDMDGNPTAAVGFTNADDDDEDVEFEEEEESDMSSEEDEEDPLVFAVEDEEEEEEEGERDNDDDNYAGGVVAGRRAGSGGDGDAHDATIGDASPPLVSSSTNIGPHSPSPVAATAATPIQSPTSATNGDKPLQCGSAHESTTSKGSVGRDSGSRGGGSRGGGGRFPKSRSRQSVDEARMTGAVRTVPGKPDVYARRVEVIGRRGIATVDGYEVDTDASCTLTEESLSEHERAHGPHERIDDRNSGSRNGGSSNGGRSPRDAAVVHVTDAKDIAVYKGRSAESGSAASSQNHTSGHHSHRSHLDSGDEVGAYYFGVKTGLRGPSYQTKHRLSAAHLELERIEDEKKFNAIDATLEMLRQACPASVAQVLFHFNQTITTGFIGQRLGSKDLAAYSVAVSVFNVCALSLCQGLISGLDTLAPQLYGSGGAGLPMGTLLHRALILSLSLASVLGLILATVTGPIGAPFLFGPTLGPDIGMFLTLSFPNLLLQVSTNVFRRFLRAERVQDIPLYCSIASVFVCPVANVYFTHSLVSVVAVLTTCSFVEFAVIFIGAMCDRRVSFAKRNRRRFQTKPVWRGFKHHTNHGRVVSPSPSPQPSPLPPPAEVSKLQENPTAASCGNNEEATEKTALLASVPEQPPQESPRAMAAQSTYVKVTHDVDVNAHHKDSKDNTHTNTNANNDDDDEDDCHSTEALHDRSPEEGPSPRHDNGNPHSFKQPQQQHMASRGSAVPSYGGADTRSDAHGLKSTSGKAGTGHPTSAAIPAVVPTHHSHHHHHPQSPPLQGQQAYGGSGGVSPEPRTYGLSSPTSPTSQSSQFPGGRSGSILKQTSSFIVVPPEESPGPASTRASSASAESSPDPRARRSDEGRRRRSPSWCEWIITWLCCCCCPSLYRNFGFVCGPMSDVLDRESVITFFAISLPSLGSAVATWWAYEAFILLAAQISDTAVAAYAVNTRIMLVLYAVPSGVGSACAILIGNALGANHPVRASRLAKLGMAISLAFVTIDAVILWFGSDWVARQYTDDKHLLSVLHQFRWGLVAVHLGDGLQVALQGVFRGAGEQKVALKIVLRAMWLLAIPVGAYLTFIEKWGLAGLYVAVVAGLCVEVPLLFLGVVEWSWPEVAARAVARSQAQREKTEAAKAAAEAKAKAEAAAVRNRSDSR